MLWATNWQWWEHYWSPALQAYPAEKWTVSQQAADRYGINWIAEKNEPGLSDDPSVIHHGHGSGFSMLNLAYLMGASRIVLIGYDLKYAPDYNGESREIGSAPRHYFGEYPKELQHWPYRQVRQGVHIELLSLYGAVAKQGLVEIINCSPDSALKCFPIMPISDVH